MELLVMWNGSVGFAGASVERERSQDSLEYHAEHTDHLLMVVGLGLLMAS
jgi:hypothetical protein